MNKTSQYTMLTINGNVGNNSASININQSLKSESFPLVIPILDLAFNLPMNISIKAETIGSGIILISPPDILVDQPIHIGCVLPPDSEHLVPDDYQISTHLHCLVLCKNKSRRFALLQGTNCYCQSEEIFSKLFSISSLVSSLQCNTTCKTDPKSQCGGGLDKFSVYAAGDYL